MNNIVEKKILTEVSESERQKLIFQYFETFTFRGNGSYIKALDLFAKKIGHAISDFEDLCFQDDFEEWEQEYDLLEGRNVGLSIVPPAYEEEVFLVMSFEEFYGQLVDAAKLVCGKYPEAKTKVYENLEKVRIALDVK
ncbi:MAG: hypothetical protein ACRCR5_05995 [Lactococcus garvieae]